MIIMDGSNYLDDNFYKMDGDHKKISLDFRVLDINTIKRDSDLKAKYFWAEHIGKYCDYYGVHFHPCCIGERDILNVKTLPTIKKVLSEKDSFKNKIIII